MDVVLRECLEYDTKGATLFFLSRKVINSHYQLVNVLGASFARKLRRQSRSPTRRIQLEASRLSTSGPQSIEDVWDTQVLLLVIGPGSAEDGH